MKRNSPGCNCCTPPVCPFLTCEKRTFTCNIYASIGQFAFSLTGIIPTDWAASALPSFETADPAFDYCPFSYQSLRESVSNIKQVDHDEPEVATFVSVGNVDNCYPLQAPGVMTHTNTWVFDGIWRWQARLRFRLYPTFLIFRKHKSTGQVSIKTTFLLYVDYGAAFNWSGVVDSTTVYTSPTCPPMNNETCQFVCTTSPPVSILSNLSGNTRFIDTGWQDVANCIPSTFNNTVAFQGFDIAYSTKQLQTWAVPSATPPLDIQPSVGSWQPSSCGGLVFTRGLNSSPRFNQPGTAVYVLRPQQSTLQRFDLVAASQSISIMQTFCEA